MIDNEQEYPKHAYELRITIGGNDWDFVLREIDDIAAHIREHGEACNRASGGWDGCSSIDIQKREVSPDRYREELMKWSNARRAIELGAGRGE